MVDDIITDERREDLEAFAASIGVKFSHIETLHVALTHKSYANEFEPRIKYNERLEFLGDAVLGLATATYLFKHFTHLKEGELTKTRSGIVRQSTLTRVADEINLGDYLLLGPTELLYGRGRDSNLEDAMEAVIGAIYLDRGWEVARDYIFRQFANEFEHVKITGIPKDYKSKLQEIIQSNPPAKLSYAELNAIGPDHDRTFEAAALIDGKIFGRGVGRSKKAAEQEAARMALQKMGELD
ncbi:MAG: ribonuclease III [Selenomonadaceae bacterium]|nr:ribonuclease III [Selenomonadaceae bacterium]